MIYSHFVEKYGNDVNSYVESKSNNYVGVKNLRKHFNAPSRVIKRYLNENRDIFEHTTNAYLVGCGKEKLNLWRYRNNISMNIEVVE